MLDRIRALLTARQLSPTQFADTIGVSRPIVSHILSGRNKPSLEVVQKIVGAFPDLSLRWLLNGEGAMLAVSPPEPVAASPRARIATVAAIAPVPMPVEAAITPEVKPMEPVVPSAAAVAAPTYPEPAAQTAPVTAPAPTQPEPAAPKLVVETASDPVRQSVSAHSEPVITPRLPAGAELTRSLATPGKSIRRIVIFYQDGTFADYQPEAAS